MISFLPLAVSACVLLSLSNAQSSAQSDACEKLASLAPELIPGVPSRVYAARVYPNNTTFVNEIPSEDPIFNAPVPNLSSFCRFGAFFNTSSTTSVQFEVWMPSETEDWNGRFAYIGVGGAAGGVPFPQMGVPLSKYRFAIASTNTGHNGSASSGTWAINNPETQFDYGHRSIHLSAVFSKNVVRAFYKLSSETVMKSYFLGCSGGGRQALKEVQMYPEDFDGVLAGSPGWSWANSTAAAGRRIALNRQGSEGYVDQAIWPIIHSSIVEQCDELDGLKDGFISSPQLCHPDFTNMNLTSAQLLTVQSLFSDWTSGNGEVLHPRFDPGSEVDTVAFSREHPVWFVARDYFLYQVLNRTTIDTNYDFTVEELERLLRIAVNTNPGLTSVDSFDISPFIDAGRKLMVYTGTQDALVPRGTTQLYFDRVSQATTNAERGLRFYQVPGTGHCCAAADSNFNFGFSGQIDASLGGRGQSPVFKPEYDVTLALIEWVEKGREPNEFIASTYVENDINRGVASQRPICAYPRRTLYRSGNSDDASSYYCSQD